MFPVRRTHGSLHIPSGGIVVLGDSLASGHGQTWPDLLTVRGYAVTNASIPGASLLVPTEHAPPLVDRLDAVLAAHPDAGTIVVALGINDIDRGSGADLLIAAWQRMAEQVPAGGRSLRLLTLAPFGRYTLWTPAKDEARRRVNEWLRTAPAMGGAVDADRRLRDRWRTHLLAHRYDCGDGIHWNARAHHVVAARVAAALVTPVPR